MTYKKSHRGKGIGKKYDDYLSNRFERFIYDMEIEVLSKWVQKHFPNKIPKYLDFACGTGRITQILEPHAKKATGADISKDMLEQARKKCKKTRFVCTDIDQKGLEEKFDLITAFRFFLNAEPKLRASIMHTLTEHLSDKGYLVFNIHMNRTSLLGMQFFIRRLLGQKDIPHTMSIREVRRMARREKLRIVDMIPLAHIPGRLDILLLPEKMLRKVERFLTKIKVLRFFAKDLIIVCRK